MVGVFDERSMILCLCSSFSSLLLFLIISFITFLLSLTFIHFGHSHPSKRQFPLWPFFSDPILWLRHLVHSGRRLLRTISVGVESYKHIKEDIILKKSKNYFKYLIRQMIFNKYLDIFWLRIRLTSFELFIFDSNWIKKRFDKMCFRLTSLNFICLQFEPILGFLEINSIICFC